MLKPPTPPEPTPQKPLLRPAPKRGPNRAPLLLVDRRHATVDQPAWAPAARGRREPHDVVEAARLADLVVDRRLGVRPVHGRRAQEADLGAVQETVRSAPEAPAARRLAAPEALLEVALGERRAVRGRVAPLRGHHVALDHAHDRARVGPLAVGRVAAAAAGDRRGGGAGAGEWGEPRSHGSREYRQAQAATGSATKAGAAACRSRAAASSSGAGAGADASLLSSRCHAATRRRRRANEIAPGT